jgi:glutaredoxin-like protein DUF836
MNANAAVPRLVLYGKPGCHLCEQAQAELARLRRRHPHALEIVDISQDPELLERYGLRIPVLVADGREYDAPLEAASIEQALARLEGDKADLPPEHTDRHAEQTDVQPPQADLQPQVADLQPQVADPQARQAHRQSQETDHQRQQADPQSQQADRQNQQAVEPRPPHGA